MAVGGSGSRLNFAAWPQAAPATEEAPAAHGNVGRFTAHYCRTIALGITRINVTALAPGAAFFPRISHAASVKLQGMRRILLGGVAGVLLLAVGTRTADALGIGGPRLRCGCRETCWCKRPGLTAFRWVTPLHWHQLGLTADEKRSRHSQA